MDKELPSINKTPDIPKIIEIKVIKLIFSFKKKYPNVDMVPAQFIAGVFSAIFAYFIASNLSISPHDLFLASLSGFFQIGFGFILITIGSQTTPSAVVGVLMLTEAVFGPLWAWFFINEIPPTSVLIGGGIIIFSILLQSFYNKKNH